MATKFNPLTWMGFNVSGGGSSSSASRYSSTFIVGDWTGPSGGVYSLSISAATHGKGVNPTIQVFELSGSDYILINVDVVVSSLGNITLNVSDTPDNRFAGKYVII